MRRLTTDMTQGDLRPYFLWDEDLGQQADDAVVDLLCLERAGHRIDDALPAALVKDGGCTPATLAWLLSEVQIPEGLALPAGISAAQLRQFVAELIVRLRRLALPSGG